MTMSIEQLKDLMKIMNRHKITEFNMKDGDFEIEMRSESDRSDAPAAPAPVPMTQVPMAMAAPVAAPAAPAVAAPAPTTPPAPAADESTLTPIKSPMPGTFYRAAGADKPPYAKVGDVIEAGQVVCMIEAMKLFNELEAEVSGRVVKVLVENAQPVEFDQVLFLVEPA